MNVSDTMSSRIFSLKSTTAADFNIVAKHCLQCGDIADMRMWWSKPSSSSESPSAPLLMMVVRARTLPLSSVQGVCSVPGNDISIIENGQISHSAPFPRHDEEDVSLRLHFDDCQHGLELIRISVLRLLVQSGFDITGVQLTNHPSLLDISVKRATSANFHLLALDEVLRTDYDVRNMERMSCGHRWAVFDETRRVPRAIQLMEDDVCCDQEVHICGAVYQIVDSVLKCLPIIASAHWQFFVDPPHQGTSSRWHYASPSAYTIARHGTTAHDGGAGSMLAEPTRR